MSVIYGEKEKAGAQRYQILSKLRFTQCEMGASADVVGVEMLGLRLCRGFYY